MEKLKREKAQAKGAFTRSKTKLLMTIDGGLSSRTKVLETVDLFAEAFERVVYTCGNLETHYETAGEVECLRAVSHDLENIEREFNETEQIVRGYLDGMQRSSAAIATAETVPAQQSIEQRTRQLEEEIARQETEIHRMTQELERTFAERGQGAQQSTSTPLHLPIAGGLIAKEELSTPAAPRTSSDTRQTQQRNPNQDLQSC